MTTFSSLGVPKVLAASLAAKGIEEPFPIQVKTLPDTLAGRDVLGRGRTGSRTSSLTRLRFSDAGRR